MTQFEDQPPQSRRSARASERAETAAYEFPEDLSAAPQGRRARAVDPSADAEPESPVTTGSWAEPLEYQTQGRPGQPVPDPAYLTPESAAPAASGPDGHPTSPATGDPGSPATGPAPAPPAGTPWTASWVTGESAEPSGSGTGPAPSATGEQPRFRVRDFSPEGRGSGRRAAAPAGSDQPVEPGPFGAPADTSHPTTSSGHPAASTGDLTTSTDNPDAGIGNPGTSAGHPVDPAPAAPASAASTPATPTPADGVDLEYRTIGAPVFPRFGAPDAPAPSTPAADDSSSAAGNAPRGYVGRSTPDAPAGGQGEVLSRRELRRRQAEAEASSVPPALIPPAEPAAAPSDQSPWDALQAVSALLPSPSEPPPASAEPPVFTSEPIAHFAPATLTGTTPPHTGSPAPSTLTTPPASTATNPSTLTSPPAAAATNPSPSTSTLTNPPAAAATNPPSTLPSPPATTATTPPVSTVTNPPAATVTTPPAEASWASTTTTPPRPSEQPEASQWAASGAPSWSTERQPEHQQPTQPEYRAAPASAPASATAPAPASAPAPAAAPPSAPAPAAAPAPSSDERAGQQVEEHAGQQVEGQPGPLRRGMPQSSLPEELEHTGSWTPPPGHWSHAIDDEGDDGPFVSTITREVGGGNVATTTSALVLPEIPRTGFSAALDATGEVLLTGSLELPRSVGSVGADDRHYDDADVDRIFDTQDREVTETGSAPVRAVRAVSTHTSSHGVIATSKPHGNRLVTALLIIAPIMAVGVIGLLVAGFVFNLF